MKPNVGDVVVSKEIIDLFKNSVRIIDKRHLYGMWPVDVKDIERLQVFFPEIFEKSDIRERYNIGIGYRGKTMKEDFSKLGFDFEEELVRKLPPVTIPIPWHFLRRAGIDHRKFNFYLTPKEMK